MPRSPGFWRYFQREVWHRSLPHGLLGIRYLWPGADARVRAHRALWWASGHGWPRPLWLLLQAWHWLRWVGFWARRASWRMVRHQRRENTDVDDWPPGSGGRVLRLALTWCIPPRDSVRFGLHRDPASALDFVYDHELGAWHRLRSLPLGLNEHSRRLLQDKPGLSEVLSQRGVPMAPVLTVAPRGTTTVDLALWLPGHEAMFCKMRSGNQGRGAFAAWRQGDGLAGRTFTGQPLADTPAVEHAWRALLQLDDALIQPRLANHPALAGLGLADEAITVRYISEWRAGSLFCLSAVLEVPTHRDEINGDTLYTILPIEAGTGRLLPWPEHARLPTAARDWVERLYRTAREQHLIHVPGWSELAGYTHQAHAAFPNIRAIAWDWVITPTGPVLLEGNVGWGAAVPQRILGGFLREGGQQ
jgi:hypothetical protein